MRWEKLGLVWGPDGLHPHGQHSALQPTPILLADGNIRVFVGIRDGSGVGRVSYVDLRTDDPTKILRVSREPVLDVGEPGCFDENGVIPCAVVSAGRKLRLYYAGYMCPTRARFIAFSGLAESTDGGDSFTRRSRVPVLDRTDSEPLFRAIHSIFKEDGRWRVWYGAGDKFLEGKKKTLPQYNIRYMESRNGFDFPHKGRVVLDIRGDEHRVGRPYVCKWPDGRYLMFYGFGSESETFKLGLAESKDGFSWERCDDQLGLGLSESGWDNEMMAYPSVIQTPSGTFLFYNGNSYGHAGFGAARLI